jgi:hypothetical protein
MKKKITAANLVRFTSKHPGQTEENDWHFAFHPGQAGMTLCGEIYQYRASGGAREPHIIRTGTPEEATCFSCLNIIEFCQSLPKLEKRL